MWTARQETVSDCRMPYAGAREGRAGLCTCVFSALLLCRSFAFPGSLSDLKITGGVVEALELQIKPTHRRPCDQSRCSNNATPERDPGRKKANTSRSTFCPKLR